MPKLARNKSKIKIDPMLIAPCGMDCGVCKAYLRYMGGPKNKNLVVCSGCRVCPKNCAFIKGHCKKIAKNEIAFCFECSDFPCRRIKTIDKRYRTKYNMSFIENLNEIEKGGLAKFVKNEQKRWCCPKCGGTISIHDKKCYDCEM